MRVLGVLLTLLLVAGTAFGATLRLQPGPSAGKDAMVRSLNPTGNYGNFVYIMYHWGLSDVCRALVEFTGLSAIPKGSTITSAALYLCMQRLEPNAYLNVHRITGPWSESTVTWNTKPRYSGDYGRTLIGKPGWYSVNVKTLVNEWVQGTQNNYGFMLRMANEGTGISACINSSDWGTPAYRPYIYVVYTPPSAVGPSSLGKVKALFD